MDPNSVDEKKQGILGVVFGWLAHPFNTGGSALNWVLFLGLLIVAAYFWWYSLHLILDE